jgi:hypothetical protein
VGTDLTKDLAVLIVDDHKSLHHKIQAHRKVSILNLRKVEGIMILGLINKRIRVLRMMVKDRVLENSQAICHCLGTIQHNDRLLALMLETWLNTGVGPPLVLLPCCNMQAPRPQSLLQRTLALMLEFLLLSLLLSLSSFWWHLLMC